jgi:hypothetical protein
LFVLSGWIVTSGGGRPIDAAGQAIVRGPASTVASEGISDENPSSGGRERDYTPHRLEP